MLVKLKNVCIYIIIICRVYETFFEVESNFNTTP